MDVRKLRNIVELLDEFDIAEVKIKSEKESVEVIRKQKQNHSPSLALPSFQPQQLLSQAPVLSNDTPDLDVKEDSQTIGDDKKIKAPMVGTFYASPSPDADAFIKVGQSIEVGDTICIIEAMKIMNRIQAEQAGVIKQILVKDSEPVQYGQVLLILE